jgi:hypothetical protein
MEMLGMVPASLALPQNTTHWEADILWGDGESEGGDTVVMAGRAAKEIQGRSLSGGRIVLEEGGVMGDVFQQSVKAAAADAASHRAATAAAGAAADRNAANMLGVPRRMCTDAGVHPQMLRLEGGYDGLEGVMDVAPAAVIGADAPAVQPDSLLNRLQPRWQPHGLAQGVDWHERVMWDANAAAVHGGGVDGSS